MGEKKYHLQYDANKLGGSCEDDAEIRWIASAYWKFGEAEEGEAPFQRPTIASYVAHSTPCHRTASRRQNASFDESWNGYLPFVFAFEKIEKQPSWMGLQWALLVPNNEHDKAGLAPVVGDRRVYNQARMGDINVEGCLTMEERWTSEGCMSGGGTVCRLVVGLQSPVADPKVARLHLLCRSRTGWLFKFIINLEKIK